jgi:hypothetical protein
MSCAAFLLWVNVVCVREMGRDRESARTRAEETQGKGEGRSEDESSGEPGSERHANTYGHHCANSMDSVVILNTVINMTRNLDHEVFLHDDRKLRNKIQRAVQCLHLVVSVAPHNYAL